MYTVQEKDDGMGGGVGWEWECVRVCSRLCLRLLLKFPKMWMEATVPSSACEERT